MASSPNLSLSQFKDIFNAALTQYTQKTGVDISNDPITVSLLPCDSSDAVLAVLQERALEFDGYRNGGWKIRFMRCLKPTVDILIGLSGVLSEGIGLVSRANRTLSLDPLSRAQFPLCSNFHLQR